MNFDTYANLKSAIADELNRSDLTVQIGGFIRLAEVQVERQLRVRQMLATSTVAVDAVTKSLPADFLEARAMVLLTNPTQPVDFTPLDDLITENPIAGRPTKFTVEGSSFRFNRTPDAAYQARLSYYQTIPRLSDANTTNWLLSKAPDVLFYGALVNSAPYLKDDARVAIWAQFFQGAIDALSVEDDRAQTASNALKAKARTL